MKKIISVIFVVLLVIPTALGQKKHTHNTIDTTKVFIISMDPVPVITPPELMIPDSIGKAKDNIYMLMNNISWLVGKYRFGSRFDDFPLILYKDKKKNIDRRMDLKEFKTLNLDSIKSFNINIYLRVDDYYGDSPMIYMEANRKEKYDL